MSLPDPITRREQYLSVAAGGTGSLPSHPITREEQYLAAIAEGGGPGGGLPPVTSEDNGDVLGVVNGTWDKMAAPGGLPPVPGSYDKAVLVGSGGDSVTWESVPQAVEAENIVAADGTTTLAQAIQAQLATWLTAAAQAPGTFTAVEGSYDFYSESATLATALSNLFDAVKPAVLINAGSLTLLAVPNLIYGSVYGLLGMYFHIGGTMKVSNTNYYVNGDVWATFTGVGISGFVMPTTMTQAPTLSGTYNSGTNTLNITGGA